jgi:SAM-dependent methyltransferase
MSGHFGGNPYKWEGGGANGPHITRYFLARGWIMPGETVLDAACATGYGSKLFAQYAKKVFGYEIDEGCIEDAKVNAPANCQFEVKDLDNCELPDVDVAISIETVEHLNNPQHFIDQIKKHVKRCFIICVPLGGTSESYKNEKPSPATEKNDYMKLTDVEKIMGGDDEPEWKMFNSFEYGYSGFVVFYKKSPEEPKV